MKKIKITAFITSLLVISGIVFAQKKNTQGVYLSAEDFRQQHLSYKCDCGESRTKIRTHDLLGSPSFSVICNGQKDKLYKVEVYGYKTCDNKIYRFFNNEPYQILDTAGFFLYRCSKNLSGPSGKGFVRTDLYYFSKKVDDDLQLLTKQNLENTFRSKTAFVYSLAAYFKSDNDLAQYDKFLKQYKLKYLYGHSIQLE